MPNDQFGRPVSVGDTVIIKGEVTRVLDDPNYMNCTVRLAQQMPPSGATSTFDLNTAQVENTSSGKPESASAGGGGKTEPTSGGKQQEPQQPPPPHSKK